MNSKTDSLTNLLSTIPKPCNKNKHRCNALLKHIKMIKDVTLSDIIMQECIEMEKIVKEII